MPQEKLTVTNPFDQQVVCEVPFDTDSQLSAKLDRALLAFRQWRELSSPKRCEIVRRGLACFEQQGETVAQEITEQMGKPIVQARGELKTMFERAEQSLVDAPVALKPDVLPSDDNLHRRIEHAPLGVVLDIAAWNYPLLIPINVIVPALLAGNVVVLKHSAKTPLTGLAFERAFGALDVPDLLLQTVLSHEQTSRLVRDPRIDHVSFTGSVGGGVAISQAAAGRFINLGLELGGKDPAYVAADADLEFAVSSIVDGACYNAGQSCCGIERVYVHRKLYQGFLEKAHALLEAYRWGDPRDESTALGPMAQPSALAELQSQVDDAIQRGARCLTGGQRIDGTSGNFYQPTLLADIPNDAVVMQEESFGPLLPVCQVSDDDEAITCMNDTRFGLTASVWTSDAERAERMARRINAGTIFQNRCDYLDPALPWSGWGESGRGSTLSRFGFYELTRRKSVYLRQNGGKS